MESAPGGASSAVVLAESDCPVASSAAEHSVGGSSSGAALPSQRECGDEMVEDLEGSEAESEHENATNSDGSFSDYGFPSSAGRVRQETGNSNGTAGPEDPSETAPGLRSNCAPSRRNLQTVYRGPLPV